MNSAPSGGGSTPAAAADAMPLFRPEVFAARQTDWLGSIRIGHSLTFSVVMTVAVLTAVALIAFAMWGDVTRKVTVHGVLLPVGGLINVMAQQSGVVAEVLAQEGDAVEAGKPLFRLKTERVTASGDAALLNAQAIAARRIALETERRLTEQSLRQRLDGLQQRRQSLQAEERQALAELDTHRFRLQLAQKSLERQQQLAREGFVATAQVQQKQEELLDIELRQRSAERNLQALQRDLQGVRADWLAAETQAQTTLAQLDRSLAALGQEAAESDGRSSLIVTAPQSGRISALVVSQGQSVQAGQTLVSVVPADRTGSLGQNSSELQAQLFAPSRTAGFVQVGQAVWLRYAAFPYQKFGMAQGSVVAISRSPIAPQDLPNGQAQALAVAAQTSEPMYRITVQLSRQDVDAYGKPMPLAAGMSLDADIQQEKRKVWEWLLDPALAVAGGKRNLSGEAKSSPGG